MPRVIPLPIFQQQADAAISQANPVSATLYTVLDTTKNVRIISIATIITWATTQPTPLTVIVTVDGRTITFNQADPVTGTPYAPYIGSITAESDQYMTATDPATTRPFLLEGRSVKVEVRVTWATTQPTPLVCRVKYAKIP